LTEFTELDLIEPLLRAVKHEGYTSATPIQAQAIPHLLAGKDLVGIAQTGTGKTAAFVLPMLQRIAGMPGGPKPKTCRGLIVAPTRELAAQIVESVRTYSRFQHLSVTMVVGGLRPGPQIKTMSRGVDVLVATPGRLLDHMATGAINIREAQIAVLDEADQMMDLGFLPAIRKIMRAMPVDRQTMLFSATMPKEIRALAADFLNEPEEISVARMGQPIEAINQKVIHCSSGDKRDILLNILLADNATRSIVFTRTKRGADKVAEHLMKGGLETDSLHGNKSQGQRDRALKAFRTGRVKVLVATDIAARGIDVEDISHVVNFELPHVPESYVHRIGRTARAGKGGIAISLCDRGETGLLRDIEKLIKTDIPSEGDVPLGPPSRAAVQRMGGQRQQRAPGAVAGNNNRRPPRPQYVRQDGERPQGDRPERERFQSDRPRGPRPEGARPQGARPQGDRPQGERFQNDRPRGDRPQGDRPQGDRPQGARPQGDRPQGERFQNDRPRGERPQGARPQGARPQGDRPQGDRPQGDRPQAARPQGAKTWDSKPGAGKPRGAKPGGGKPMGGKPMGAKPARAKPANDAGRGNSRPRRAAS
jgi:ATP-dependent RNA helicase RhlE